MKFLSKTGPLNFLQFSKNALCHIIILITYVELDKFDFYIIKPESILRSKDEF